MKTAVEWYNEQLNLYGDMAFNKEISLGQYHIKKQELLEQAKEMEKEQIVIAEIETLRVIEKYGISSIDPLINELKNQIETFKSE